MFESIDKMHEFLFGSADSGEGGGRNEKIEVDDDTVKRIADAVISKLNYRPESKQEETKNELESEDDN